MNLLTPMGGLDHDRVGRPPPPSPAGETGRAMRDRPAPDLISIRQPPGSRDPGRLVQRVAPVAGSGCAEAWKCAECPWVLGTIERATATIRHQERRVRATLPCAHVYDRCGTLNFRPAPARIRDDTAMSTPAFAPGQGAIISSARTGIFRSTCAARRGRHGCRTRCYRRHRHPRSMGRHTAGTSGRAWRWDSASARHMAESSGEGRMWDSA